MATLKLDYKIEPLQKSYSVREFIENQSQSQQPSSDSTDSNLKDLKNELKKETVFSKTFD